MSNPDWVILDANDQKIICKRCWAYAPIPTNVPVMEFSRLCREFSDKHDACVPFKRGDLIIPEGDKFPGRTIVFDRMEAGRMFTYPRGGGFEGSFAPEAIAKYKFRKVTEEEQRLVQIRKTRFEIDGWETSFEGYTWGDRWNGWACPAFEKKQADRIWALQRKDGNEAKYDKATDTFILIRDGNQEDKEIYKGEKHLFASQELVLYPIGSMVWTWSEKERKKKTEKKT
jgi:hypothetical protein